MYSNTEEEQKHETEVSEEVAQANREKAKMHYVRDDLDDIDDNDVGEKKRLAFLDFLLELTRNGSSFSEEEVKEEVNTIMFEVTDNRLLN